MRLRWHPCDLPYACFLGFGALVLSMALIRASYTDAEWENGAGAIFLLLLPVIAVGFSAGLIGVVLTLWLWREWPLPVLAVASVAVVAAGFFASIPAWLQTAIPMIYGAGACVVCGLWFSVIRRRQLRRVAGSRSLP